MLPDTEIYTDIEHNILSCCNLCPRRCLVNRYEGGKGFCSTDAGMNIAAICIHKGEEPPISGSLGICNIFFAGCNLHCIYCQNHEISRTGQVNLTAGITYKKALDTICNILSNGIKTIGFVSPSHVVPQVKAIIRGLNERGLKPVTVYNTNGYDLPEVIDSLAGMIDIYLPDYKYCTFKIAEEYSNAADYPEVALKALKRMYFQMGSSLLIDRDGYAEKGLLIRHLVLPGHSEESKKVLKRIAEELSPGVHISLMSQYHPTKSVKNHPVLNRALYREEYESVVKNMENLDFRNVWIQDMDSDLNYLPDFSREHPFE